MIELETWHAIQALKARGKGKKQVARELGLSRNTVRRYWNERKPPRYSREPRPNAELEKLREVISFKAFKQDLIGSRILDDLRNDHGYQGSAATLYRFLHALRAERGLLDPQATLRYETEPGQQGQFDWSTYSVRIAGQLERLVVFGLVLGFSRRKFYWPSRDQTQASVFEAIEEALWHLGAAPLELVVDNHRSMVLNPKPERFRWNPRFLELCGHYGMTPVACTPRKPRAKGKIENPFFPLEQHFIKGREFQDFDHLHRELARFTEKLNHKVHGTTQQRPIERFEEERSLLIPLPAIRWIGSQEEFRKASGDCLISFRGTRYSVPHPYAGKHVWLRVSQGRLLKVYNQKAELVAEHALSAQKGVTVIVEAHYAGLRQRSPRSRTVLRERFLQLFPEQAWFLDALLIQQRFNPAAHLQAILELSELYPREVLLKAFELARTYNTYSHRFLAGVLRQESPSERDLPSGPRPLMAVPSLVVERSLGVYQRVLDFGGEHARD